MKRTALIRSQSAHRPVVAAAVTLLLMCSFLSIGAAEQGFYAPVGACDTAGEANGVAVVGSYAYIADNTALRVISVSDHANPVEVGHFDGLTNALDVAVSGSYAYVVDGTNGLWVFDISSPWNPSLAGRLTTTSQQQTFLSKSIALKGAYAIIGTYAQGTRFVSVANPAQPVEVALQYGALWGADVTVDGDYAYVADLYGDTWIYDVLDPADPQGIIAWDFGGAGTYSVAAVSGWAYVSDTNGLNSMYAPDPGHPSGGGARVNGACGRVKLTGGYAYVAWDVASHPDGGLEVIDESDPEHPVVFGYWNTAGQSRNLDIANGCVYLADGDNGLVIFRQAAKGGIAGQVRIHGTTTGIAGATVEAAAGGVVKASATTDANGMYSISALLPGAYDVTARKQGYASQTQAAVAVGVGQTASVNFELDVVCLTGQMRAAVTGVNLAGATVAAYQGDVLKGSATSNAAGIYQIGNLAAGTYTVVASKSGNVRQTKPGIAVAAGAPTYVNFALAVSGKLTGQVVDRVSGAPIIGAAVAARTGGVVQATGVTTAPYGVYDIASDLPAGTYTMLASKAGYVDQGKIGIVVSAGATTYVNFGLGKICLMGQVRQAGTTTALAGVTVAAYQGDLLKGSGTTDANVIYQIGGLATGAYTVVASKTGYVKQTKPGISVTASEVTYVNFALGVSGKLMGQVWFYDNGQPIIGATVSARTGGVVQATGTTVGPYGIYTISSDLPAGTYTMLCTAPGYQDFGRLGIVVTAGNTTYVNFPMRPRSN
jgi:hypothetical protein